MTDDRTSMIGPVGKTVISNVEQLRKARGLSLRDLAARLAKLGRPIGDTVLHRQSQGKRRIDADDLVALAVALGVNPNALLLPRDVPTNELVDLTPDVHQRSWVAWAWADANLPLPMETVAEDATEVDTPMSDVADFVKHARPGFRQSEIHASVRAIHELLKRVILLLDDYGNPATFDYRDEYVRRSLERVRLELDELIAGSNREAQRYAPSPTPGPDGRLPLALGQHEEPAPEWIRQDRKVNPLDPFGRREG